MEKGQLCYFPTKRSRETRFLHTKLIYGARRSKVGAFDFREIVLHSTLESSQEKRAAVLPSVGKLITSDIFNFFVSS